MRTIKESILSTTKVGRFDPWNVFKAEHAHPKDKEELKSTIKQTIKLKGPNVDLNWIDTSKITDMENLFYVSGLDEDFAKFDGDISKWDVSNVTDMSGMFNYSRFSGDISKWDVSNVRNMTYMFHGARFFKCNLSKWDVHNVKHMWDMFKDCPLEKNPPVWYKE